MYALVYFDYCWLKTKSQESCIVNQSWTYLHLNWSVDFREKPTNFKALRHSLISIFANVTTGHSNCQ